MKIIAIDTAKGLRYTGAVSGYHEQFNNFYNIMDKILAKAGAHSPYHWHKINRKIRDKVRVSFNNLVNESQLNFNIFDHERPPKQERKIFYIDRLPKSITENYVSWLKYKRGAVVIKVDNDFNIKTFQTEQIIL